MKRLLAHLIEPSSTAGKILKTVSGRTQWSDLRVQDATDVDWSTPPTNGQLLLWDSTEQKFNPANPPAGYSDEQAQDAVAALLAAGSHTGISFAYDDAGNKLSATVTGGGGGGSSVGSASTLDSLVLGDAPWGFWKTGDATSIPDASPNGRNLTITGTAPTYTNSSPLAANNDALLWPDGAGYARAAVTAPDSAGTFVTFLNLPAFPSTATPLFSRATTVGTAANSQFEVSVGTDGRVRFYVYDTSNTERNLYSSALTVGQWYLVACSIGANGMKLRINKTTVDSISGSTALYTGGSQTPTLRAAGYTALGTKPVKTWRTAYFSSQLSDAKTDAYYDAVYPSGSTGGGSGGSGGTLLVDYTSGTPTIPSGTAANTIIFMKPPPVSTWNFAGASALPSGWTRRGITSETFSANGMTATLATGQGWLYPMPSPDGTLEVGIYTGTYVGTMQGGLLADASGNGVGSVYYNAPAGQLAILMSGWNYGSSYILAESATPTYPVRMRVRKNGTSYFVSISHDGGTTWSGETAYTAWGGTPTQIFIGSAYQSGSMTVAYAKWTPVGGGGAKGYWDGSAYVPF